MTRPVVLMLSAFLPFLPVHLLWSGDAPASVPADLVVVSAIWEGGALLDPVAAVDHFVQAQPQAQRDRPARVRPDRLADLAEQFRVGVPAKDVHPTRHQHRGILLDSAQHRAPSTVF